VIREQAQSVGKRLRKLELYGATVKVKIRWPDFTKITRQNTLPKPTDNADAIEAMALEIFHQHWKPGRKVRLLGVGISNLGPPSQQLNLWDWNPKDAQKQEQLDLAIKQLTARYGSAAVQNASKLKSS
jgi:DNA polymerase-4